MTECRVISISRINEICIKCVSIHPDCEDMMFEITERDGVVKEWRVTLNTLEMILDSARKLKEALKL